METRTTKINGKQVTLAYCWGTEINYGKFTNGDNASIFIHDTAIKVDALRKGDANAQPDIEKCIYLILSAAIAYYKSKDEECPITADDFLFTSEPKELYEALGHVILLYGEFYHLTDADKPKQKKKGKAEKN